MRHDHGKCLLVIGKITVLVGRRRLAVPLTFDLGAQPEHGFESIHIEARIGLIPGSRLQQGVRFRERRFLQSPLLLEQVKNVRPKRGIEELSLRFDVGGKVLYNCHGVIARPGTSRESANRLVGTDQSVRGAETYKSCALGNDGGGWTEDGRGVLLVIAHRLQSLRRCSKRNQLVVASSTQTVIEKNFFSCKA